ncbi:MAG TPA: SDR family oxidoreductase [Acidimicrobiales bacterium]|nr:SDR family oxidoreductase [Acidimicrobiales bacterium]
MELRGKRVLITGGSRGIGEGLARRFSIAGASVALVARSADAIEKLAADLGGTAHPADLADPTQVATLINHVEDEAGPVDVLVNNAGVDLEDAFWDHTPDEVDRIVRVNLTTPMELCRQVIPRMLRRGRGHIVNVSSLAACGVYPGLAAYSATKAGLSQFTAGLRADLKKLPIGTTLVEMAGVPTDMLASVDSYKPTAESFKRGYRLHLVTDTPLATIVNDTVEAVERNRRHVRHPKRAVLFPLLSEGPRRMTEWLLIGVKPRP